MDFLYAFLGFVALIVLHEGGHFVAAKAVGMRVERFMLFFPPILAKVRRGETEYGVGVLPFGGYVKITGMSPNEDIPPEILPRAYYSQPVWKRIVVIAAGPAVNIALAILIVFLILWVNGEQVTTTNRSVATVQKHTPAAGVLHPGDTILSVDGRHGSAQAIHDAIQRHRCSGRQTLGCEAATPAQLVVRRRRRLVHLAVRPQYREDAGLREMLVGIEFGQTTIADRVSAPRAFGDSVTKLWSITKQTVSAFAHILVPKERRQLSGVVGTYTVTERSFHHGSTDAFEILALISLSLGVINLFPFLPLDGGHIFWALAEKVRGRRIPFAVMERAGIVGFVLILALFAIGLTNDIHSLSTGGLQVR